MHVIDVLREGLRPRSSASRFLYAVTVVFLVAAAGQAIYAVATGAPWDGAVSLRKPVVFALSVGLLLGTVGWILDHGRPRRRLAPLLAGVFAVASVGEVGLITLQAWRGRASHFNVATAGDAAIFGAMGALVGVMSLCLLTVFVWVIRDRGRDPLVGTALVAGMALVMLGLGIGQMIIAVGTEVVASTGVVPDTVLVGDDGVAKFPHAVALHGIQAFIIAAVALRGTRSSEPFRRRRMRQLTVAYSVVLVAAMAQTLLGRAPLAPTITGGVGVLATAATAAVLLRIMVSLYRHPRLLHDAGGATTTESRLVGASVSG